MGLLGLISGGLQLAGSIIGGNSAKKASRKAEAAQLEAARLGIEEQRRQFDLTRSDYAPYLETGTEGLGQLGDFIGTNGADAQALALQGLQNSPELAAIIRNGEEAILANASATGGLRGGNTQDALSRYRGDTFATMIGQQIQRLAGLAGMGQGATDSVSAFGANTANNVTGLLGQQGAARAQGLLTRGGINAQMWNNIGQFGGSLAGMIPGIGK